MRRAPRITLPPPGPRLPRIGVALLLVFAAGSLLVDALVVGEVWHLRQVLDTQLLVSVQLAQDTLATSDDTLIVLDNQIQTVSSVMSTDGTASHSTVRVIDATDQSLQFTLHILRTELPASLDGVQAALVSAQSAAALVDATLGALPFIPGLTGSYNPQVPLHVALGNLAQSMEQLPTLTRTLADDLAGADAALPEARRDVTSMAQTLEQSPVAANQLHLSILQYRDQVSRLRREVADLHVIADQWITWVAIAVTFFVIWIAVVQVTILLMSLQWLRGGPLLLFASRPSFTTAPNAEPTDNDATAIAS